MDIKTSQKIFNQLETKILEAQKLNKPFDSYVKEQIKILEGIHDEFVSSNVKKNKNILLDINFAGIQIKQLQAISSLCQKIGLPTEKYENKIREIRVKHLGVDFVKEHFS